MIDRSRDLGKPPSVLLALGLFGSWRCAGGGFPSRAPVETVEAVHVALAQSLAVVGLGNQAAVLASHAVDAVVLGERRRAVQHHRVVVERIEELVLARVLFLELIPIVCRKANV